VTSSNTEGSPDRMAPRDALLPEGTEVAFSDIEGTLARLTGAGRSRKRVGRALTATLVVVGSPARLRAAAEAIEGLGRHGGVRAILMSEGTASVPAVRVTEHAILLDGLAPRYMDNAVAALRLSSLPAVIWWRGGAVEALEELAALADRVVLDTENPDEVWRHVEALSGHTAVTDLRWARLTRWRAVLAHLFDLPQVRGATPQLRDVTVTAHDVGTARLFAGWVISSLPSSPLNVHIERATSDAPSAIESVHLTGEDVRITLCVRPTRTCLEATVSGVDLSSRVVPLDEGTLSSWIGEELGVRTRDYAFERALRACRKLTA
jgi:glucose-6-phosphate dehydrogenase assembly protein OpcA